MFCHDDQALNVVGVTVTLVAKPAAHQHSHSCILGS